MKTKLPICPALRDKRALLSVMAVVLLPAVLLLAVFVMRSLILRGDSTLVSPSEDISLAARFCDAYRTGSLRTSIGHYDFFFRLASLFTHRIERGILSAWVLTVVFASLSMYVSVRGLGCDRVPSLFAGIAWSFSAFAFLSFLDAGASCLAVLLPLGAFSLYLLVTKRMMTPHLLFWTALSLSYTRGVWVCLVCLPAAFLFFYFFMQKKEERQPILPLLLRLLCVLATAALASLVSLVDLSAFLKSGKPDWKTLNFDLMSLFSKFLPGVYDGLDAGALPYVWMGMPVLLILPVYFSSEKIPKAEKAVSGCFLGLLLLSLIFDPLQKIIGLYSFAVFPAYLQVCALVFCSLFLAARTLTICEGKTASVVFAALGFLVLVLLFIQKSASVYVNSENKEYLNKINATWVTLFVAFAAAFAVIAYLREHERAKRAAVAVLFLAVVCFESVFGTAKLVKAFQSDHLNYSRSDLRTLDDAQRAAAAYLRSASEKGETAASVYSLARGDSVLYGLKNYAFSSDDAYAAALSSLGYRSDGGRADYRYVSSLLDALTGVSYLVLYQPVSAAVDGPETARSDMSKTQMIREDLFPDEDDTVSLPVSDIRPDAGYVSVYRTNTVTVYRNAYSQGLIYSSAQDLSDLDFSLPGAGDLTEDETSGKYILSEAYLTRDLLVCPTDRINAVYSRLVGTDVDLFVAPANVNLTFTKTTQTVSDLGNGLTLFSFVPRNGVASPETATVNIDYTVTDEFAYKNLLLQLPSFFTNGCKVYVDGAEAADTSDCAQSDFVLSLGAFPSGKQIEIQIKYAAENGASAFFSLLSGAGVSYLCAVDDESVSDVLRDLARSTTVVKKVNERTLTATITPARGQTMICSALPAEGAFVSIDGQKTETSVWGEAFLTFSLPDDGEHEIKITYRHGVNRPGVLVFSIIGICGIVALSVYEGVCLYRKRKDETTAKSDRTKADAHDGAPLDDQTIRNKKPPQGKHGGKR